MSNLDAARFQMAFSLAFHMIFASLGVGMPLLMFIAEGLHLRTGEVRFLQLAKAWAKATGILFAIGAVSGTALSFEMGLLWPRFMGLAGSTIGPAFSMEGFAFFLEAIFIGIYLYGWDRISKMAHWLSGLVVAIAGAASSLFVVATNAWMQNPLGAELLATNPEAIDPMAVLFGNPAYPLMAIHSTLATYAATGFAVAGVYAWQALRGRMTPARQAGLMISLAVATLAALTMPVTGHASAQDVAVRQPAKLAAMEALYHTEKAAPLLIGGMPNTASREVRLAIRIPYGLSILAFNDPQAEVKGLDIIPQSDWPNVPLVHISFQVMVGAGTLVLPIVFWYWWTRHRRGPEGPVRNRALLWAVLAASPLGFIALEAGWIVTEVGRQPWIAYHVMRTAEAVTPAPDVIPMLWAFVALYAFLGVVLVVMLNRLAGTKEELSYGPTDLPRH